MKNNHETYNLEELLAGYVLGNLEENELSWLNKQLEANPQLQQEIDELSATLTLMPYSLPNNLPSSDLRSKISHKILNNNQAKYLQLFKGNSLAWLISGIAAVSTLLLGVNNYVLRQELAVNNYQSQQQQELISLLRQPHNRLVSLRGLNELPDASGSLFIAPPEAESCFSYTEFSTFIWYKSISSLGSISRKKNWLC